ncbi:MAG: ABC transporter permease [Candidatus Limnocylindrales bacterium]
MTSAPTEARASSRPGPARFQSLRLIGTGLGEIIGRRRLTRYVVGANLKRTHADTLFGQLWWILDPLLQMAVYIVFVTIIFARKTPDFPLFVFAAILPWKWFTTGLADATTSVTTRQQLIRQIQFPKIILPTSAIVAETVSFAFGLIALGIVYLFYRDRITAWLVLLPLVAAVQFLFTMGLALMLAAANAFFRDIQNIERHVLRLWFYLSPGLYSLASIASDHKLIQDILRLNPFAILFQAYQALIWGSEVNVNGTIVDYPPGPPDFGALLGLSIVSIGLILVGVLIFKKAEPAFARIL